MNKEKQIEDFVDFLWYKTDMCDEALFYDVAEALVNEGYRKQKEGMWEWFEEWSQSTPEHPRECDDCGWRCSECKTALEDIMGGYWDNYEQIPNLHFCPNCGAHMKGE